MLRDLISAVEGEIMQDSKRKRRREKGNLVILAAESEIGEEIKETT